MAIQVGFGIGVGAVVAIWAGRFAASLLYGLTARDPAAIVGASIALAAIGLIAGGLPAFRASRIDSVRTLREN